MSEEIEAIQDRLREQYGPRPGETWLEAAERHGRMSVQLWAAMRESTLQQLDRLSATEMDQLEALLAKMTAEPSREMEGDEARGALPDLERHSDILSGLG